LIPTFPRFATPRRGPPRLLGLPCHPFECVATHKKITSPLCNGSNPKKITSPSEVLLTWSMSSIEGTGLGLAGRRSVVIEVGVLES